MHEEKIEFVRCSELEVIQVSDKPDKQYKSMLLCVQDGKEKYGYLFETPEEVFSFAMELIKAASSVWAGNEFVKEHSINAGGGKSPNIYN